MTHNRPTDAELLDAVIEFLDAEVQPELTRSDITFKLRIAINVLGIVKRQCESADEYGRRERKALQDLLGSPATELGELNEELCTRLRRGDFDEHMDEALSVLKAVTMDKLAVDNPRYSTYRDLKASGS